MRTSKASVLVQIALLAGAGSALAHEKYELSITNGSGMPLSPGALYVSEGQDSVTEIGKAPSAGFVKLCTSGDNSVIIKELQSKKSIHYTTATPGLVLPGQTIHVTFEADRLSRESVHFVAMYGATKDTCAVIDLNNNQLREVAEGNGTVWRGVDHAVATGAFGDPSLPANPQTACPDAKDSIGCIRELTPALSSPTIRFFPGYLPSVLNYVESRFGSSTVKPLLLQGGASAFQLKATW